MDGNRLAEGEIKFFPGIKLGPNGGGSDNLCPVLVGILNQTGLQLKNCDVYLDRDRMLTATTLQSTNLEARNMATQNLTISGSMINKVTTQVSDPRELNSLLTLNGVTQYVQSEIKSIKTLSPWVIQETNIYYDKGWVGIGSINSSMMRLSSTQGKGNIEVDKTRISISKSNLVLDAEGIEITSPILVLRSPNKGIPGAGKILLEAQTTEIISNTFQLNGNFQLGKSTAVNNVINDLTSASQNDLRTTLPTAQAVTDYIKKIISAPGETLWKNNSSNSIFYSGGNVGIGTETPKAKLHVASGAIMPSSGNAEDNGILFPSDPGGGSSDSAWIRHYAKEGESCVLEIGISNDQGSKGDHIAILPSGLLGIGTNNPSKAKVEIVGTIETELGWQYNYMNAEASNYTGRENYRVTAPYSLHATGRIASGEFNAFSDVRIKDIIGLSDSIADLNTLLKIQVTDYSYKDKIQQGHGQHKKVIGQQIARIFPQAVKTHTDVIPNIFRPATISGAWVQLPCHGLSVGERVRLFWKDSEPVIYNIEEASKDSFRVPLQFEGEIFVYGREVDDFHVVDYEAISMLHVSATQELYKIIQGLKQDVEDLKTQLATMNGTGLSPIAHA